MIDTLIDLVDMVVSIAPKVVVMVVPLMFLMEVVQVALPPLNLEEGVGMLDILNLNNLNIV